MKDLTEYFLDDGSSILIEVEELPESGIELIGIEEDAAKSFEKELDKIRPVADALITKFRTLKSKPDEVQVEFGLKMSAKAGAVFTSAGVEATFKVTLKWSME